MKPFKILTIGGATQDITFHTKEGVLVNNPQEITCQKLLGFELGAKLNISRADFTFGGGATNTAVNLANLGNNVTSLICVGQDGIGQEIVKNLKKFKIKTDLIQYSAEKLSGVSCIVNAKNLADEHTIFTYRGANEDLKIDPDELRGLKFDWIYLTSLSGKNAKNNLAKVFRYKNNKLLASSSTSRSGNKSKIAWNPGSQQVKLGINSLKIYFKQTDILIINKDEAVELCLEENNKSLSAVVQLGRKVDRVGGAKAGRRISPRDLLKKLAEFCLGIIVITDGENGAYAYYNKKLYFEPALRIREKDTTGVGDAFGSTFVWALEDTNNDMQKSLNLAIKNAGAVLKQVGAQNGLLSKSFLMSS